MQKITIVETGTIAERAEALIAHFSNGNATAFGRIVAISPGVLATMMGGRKSKPGFELMQRILTGFPTVSPDWLLFGSGPMLRPSGPQLMDTPAPLAEALPAGLFSVEWRLWLTVDFLDSPLSVGFWKHTQEPTVPSTGDLFAGLVGEGEQAPLMQVSTRYQLSGRRAYVVEVEVFNAGPSGPEQRRTQLEEAGWGLLAIEARKIAPTQATPPW